MRTTRLLPVSPSMHCSGGCTCPGGVPAWGVYLLKGGVLGQGGVPAWGVYLPRYSPLWTEFLTHATENITLPQLSLRVVTMPNFFIVVFFRDFSFPLGFV